MILYNIATVSVFALVLISLALSLKVRSDFNKYTKFKAVSGVTGAKAAQTVLERAGVFGVAIKQCKGTLTDHYDPRDNTVYLSEKVYSSSSISAIGVAAHEAGHAVQYAKNYSPVKIRSAMVPAVNFSARISIVLILIALLVEALSSISNTILIIGIALYAVYTVFTVVTLPVELNASKRAKALLLEAGVLNSDEIVLASKVLNSAAMTYVASMALSLMQLLRYIGLLNRRR